MSLLFRVEDSWYRIGEDDFTKMLVNHGRFQRKEIIGYEKVSKGFFIVTTSDKGPSRADFLPSVWTDEYRLFDCAIKLLQGENITDIGYDDFQDIAAIIEELGFKK